MEIKATVNTPYIKFDTKLGLLEIKGRSVPENATQFYMFLFENITQYAAKPVSPTQVNIHLEYYNTTSSFCIIRVLKQFKEIETKGCTVIINWIYDKDDLDVKEAGEDFQSVVNLPFNFIKAQ
jgi:hypothetical protein